MAEEMMFLPGVFVSASVQGKKTQQVRLISPLITWM